MNHQEIFPILGYTKDRHLCDLSRENTKYRKNSIFECGGVFGRFVIKHIVSKWKELLPLCE